MADEKPKSNIIRPNGNGSDMSVSGDQFKEMISKSLTGVLETLTMQIRDNFNEFAEDISNTLNTVEENIPLDEITEDDKAKGATSRSREVIGVEIVKVSDDVLRKLNFGLGDTSVTPTKKEDKEESGMLAKALKAALPLIALGTGFAASISTMLGGGTFQGISNILSKIFVKLFDKIATGVVNIFTKGKFFQKMLMSIFGKGMTKSVLKVSGKLSTTAFGKILGKGFAKRLPIIGSLISFGSAVRRIKDGDAIGGAIDIGAAAAYMFPGIGTAIGIGLDLLNATMDVGESNPDAMGGVAGALAKFKNWIAKNARNMPILGVGVRLGEALGYFASGNVKTGFKALLGSGAGLVPFLGPVYDWLFGSTDPEADDSKKTNKVANVFKFVVGYIRDILWDKVMGFINAAKNWVADKAGELGNVSITALEKVGVLPKGGDRADRMEYDTEMKARNILRDPNSTKIQQDNAYRALEKAGFDTTRVRERVNRRDEKKKDEQQAKRDAMMASKMDEMIQAYRESGNATNVGVRNSNSSNVNNINVQAPSMYQQKKNVNPFTYPSLAGTGQ